MQRHRFHAHPEQFTDRTVILDADESHHLTRVLRLGVDDRVFVFDGEGSEWLAEVSLAGKREVELKLVKKIGDVVDSSLHLTLGQAMIKGDKFDLVIQKATELGVTRIVPLITAHCDVRVTGERIDNKLTRWRRIALESVKQCGRRRMVEIAEPAEFADLCGSDDSELKLFFSERGGESLRHILRPGPASLLLAVGPEGGWSDQEIETAESAGFRPIHLGPRILRAETAGIAAIALAQHLFGDL
ncbi:MAG: 16S rRNA (uracil(1498)-N(3))-methyltransferase [Blastocatellales bacterium]